MRMEVNVARWLVCMAGLGAFVLSGSALAVSLYGDDTYRPLVIDHRAARPGDTLTVLIVESASASTSARTDTSKESSVNVLATDGHGEITGQLAVAGAFDGNGTINRAGQIVARVSVTVQEVLPNGELGVRGEQVLEFNNERQFIRVVGRVRPEDISAQNTVLSSRLSESKIDYTGEGLLTNREKPGLITRFFNWLF